MAACGRGRGNGRGGVPGVRSADGADLTARNAEMVRLHCAGVTKAAIGRQFGISGQTVAITLRKAARG